MTYFTETSEKEKPLTKKEESLLRQMVERHYGPGPHSGTGSSQDVHGGNGKATADLPSAVTSTPSVNFPESISHSDIVKSKSVKWAVTRGGRVVTLPYEGTTHSDLAEVAGIKGDRDFHTRGYSANLKNRDVIADVFYIINFFGMTSDRAILNLGRVAKEVERFGPEMRDKPRAIYFSYDGGTTAQRVGVEELTERGIYILRGGPGSGHHGHSGRPGHVGGSLSAELGKLELEYGVQRIPAPKRGKPVTMHLWRGESKSTPVDEGMYGKGTYFTPHRHYAEGFAYEGRLIEAEVTLKKPFVGTYSEIRDLGRAAKQAVFDRAGTIEEANIANANAIRKTLEDQGYDGIIIITYESAHIRPNTVNEVLVFTPTEAVVEIVARHYGPGPHPGTGTSQDVHGGGSGLGEFDFGSEPSRGYRTIPFDNTYATAPTGMRRLAKKEQQETGEFRWAYWDSSDPDNPHTKMFENKEAAMEFIADKMREQDYEIHYTFSDATMFFEHTQKHAHRIKFDRQDISALRELSNRPENINIINLHNHPPQESGIDIPPSFSDFDFAMGQKDVNEWWVVAPNGKYVVTRGEVGIPHFSSSDVYQLEDRWNGWMEENVEHYFDNYSPATSQMRASRDPEYGQRVVEFRKDLIQKVVEDSGYFNMEWIPNE